MSGEYRRLHLVDIDFVLAAVLGVFEWGVSFSFFFLIPFLIPLFFLSFFLSFPFFLPSLSSFIHSFFLSFLPNKVNWGTTHEHSDAPIDLKP